MLERGALVAAGRARGPSTGLIARCVGTPADQRMRSAPSAGTEPEPRCGAVRVTEGRGGACGLHADGEDVETLNLAHGQMGDKRRLDLPDDDPNPSNEEGAYLSSVLTGNDANWLEIN
jgi:hypothetical protein